jgi:hypothetical protein
MLENEKLPRTHHKSTLEQPFTWIVHYMLSLRYAITSLEVDDASKVGVLSDLRQAWHEVITGHMVPASQICVGIAL